MSDKIRDQLNARLFYIVRHGDESGVSGTGRVLDGILWANGWVNVMWRTDLDPLKAGMSSLTFFPTFRSFMDIHVNSHPTNETEIVWVDEEVNAVKEELVELKDKFAKKSEKLKEANKELRDMRIDRDVEEFDEFI